MTHSIAELEQLTDWLEMIADSYGIPMGRWPAFVNEFADLRRELLELKRRENNVVGIAAELLAMKQRERWIPIGEVLPEHRVEVLVAMWDYSRTELFPYAAHLGDGPAEQPRMWYLGSDYYDFDRVTAWKPIGPLPAPPASDTKAKEI